MLWQTKRAITFLLLILTPTAALRVLAQPSSAPAQVHEGEITPLAYYPMMRLAQQHIESGQYGLAINLLEKLVRAQSADGGLWLTLGSAHFALRQYRAAIPPYMRAIELGFVDAAQGAYQIARCYAQLGEQEPTLAWLEKALHAGYRYKTRLGGDEQLQSLRAEPRFLKLIGQLGASTVEAERVAGWKADLDYLVAEVRRVHSRYRNESLPAEFVRAVSETSSAIPKLTDEELVVKVQRLLALLGDGHTLIYPFGMKRGALKRLPLSFYLFSDGLYIIGRAREFAVIDWSAGGKAR